MKFDILMQGRFHEYTFDFAYDYAELDYVNKVVISTWRNHNDPYVWLESHPKIEYVFSEDVDYAADNRNRQIYSTLAGLKKCTSEFTLKTRTDQFIYLKCIDELRDFYDKHKEPVMHYHDNPSMPHNRMCVAGMYKTYPYCPRDHYMMGNTKDLIEFFDIPLDYQFQFTPERQIDFNQHGRVMLEDFEWNTRCEIYMGAWYCAKFDKRVYNHLWNYKKYLTDLAPDLNESIDLSKEIVTKIMKPFPRNGVDFMWPSHGRKNYYYDFQAENGQFWAEDTSEWNKD
jgi:hypothetical protein